jgi:outer membrane protein assembly factor BamB
MREVCAMPLRRTLLSLFLLAVTTFPAFAQRVTVPPSDAELDRGNLKLEWSAAIPISGPQDGLAQIQVAREGQVFVQTKTGLFVALDAKTGNQQWSLKFNSKDVAAFPVAYNDRFAVIVNLVTLYCVNRYTGLVEFQMQLPLVPSAGPVIERNTVYVTMNGIRVTAYELPEGIRMPERRAKNQNAFGSTATDNVKNPADLVAGRYASSARTPPTKVDRFDERKVSLDPYSGSGASVNQRAPSLSILPTTRPPFTAFDNQGKYILRAESLSTLPSLRQPYALQDPTQATAQRTPSIAAIPPSVAALYQTTSLLPRPFEPRIRWVHGSTTRLSFTPLTTNFRVWFTGRSSSIEALLQDDRSVQINAKMPNIPAAQPTQGDDIGYIPLIDGNLLAVDLAAGGGSALKLAWRSNVGGAMNRPPVVAQDAVYQGGDSSGVARVDRTSGEVLWRTDETADTVLALNDGAVYVRDKSGQLRIYDRNRITDTNTKRAVQLASVDLSSFDMATTNFSTDRVFLGSTSGTLICLRDKDTKYATAKTMAPPLSKPDPTLVKPAPMGTPPATGEAPPAATPAPAPMAEQPKKDEPKKDEPKKN